MSLKKTADFSVKYLQILDKDGNVDRKFMPSLTQKLIKKMYGLMAVARAYDARVVSLQRQGRVGTYGSFLGQEAAQVGSALALDKGDWMVPSYRENGSLIARGYPLHRLFLFWGGDERGHKVKGKNTPTVITVGAQNLHAVGIGMALNIQKRRGAVLSYFGDGASSKGDFHEAANFAGVYKVPVVFFCSNNQYAISLSRKDQTAAKTIAQKAIGYGFNGMQVDGNDIFAVYKATKKALYEARKWKKPFLIEAVTYRLNDHTTSDDSKRYRTKREVSYWKERDPILRLRKYMIKKGFWGDKDEEKLHKKVKRKIDMEVRKFENVNPPSADDIFDSTFKKKPPELEEQLNELKQVAE